MRTARLVLVALLLTGCTVPGGVAPSAQPPQPTAPRAPVGTGLAGGVCYLVTDAEIASVFGRAPIGGGSGFELGGIRYCNWSMYFDPMEAAGITVSRAVNHEDGRFDPWEPVAGLGEDAYWQPGLLLSVKTGPYRLTVTVFSESKDPKAAAIAIARIASGRLH